MNATEEIIAKMEKLPPEEIREIIEHFQPEEEFSEEITRQLLQAKKDADEGINMSPELEGEEITNYLDQLKVPTT